jgi:xylulokinase
MSDALLGLDVGTTSTKAVLFDLEGKELARASSNPYHNYSPQPGWVEQDPEEIWQAVVDTLTMIMQQSSGSVQVRAISMAAQSGSLLPANKLGEPVYPLITWLDGRSEKLVADWKKAGIQEKVKPISGWSLNPGLCLPTIAWLRQHNPEVFWRTAHYFSVNDFIAHRLTGTFISNPSNAGGMQLIDLQSGGWSEELCELAGIHSGMLSDLQPSGSIIGEVTPDVCQQTGLNPGIVLVNGGHDQVCTALGLGINDSGKYLLACGTAWVFTGILSSPAMSALPPTLDLNFHAYPQRWTLSQSLGGLGASVEWWLNRAWQGVGIDTSPQHVSRQEKFKTLNQELAETSANHDLFFLPMTGGHDDPSTTRRGGFMGLDFNHTRAEMARAIMESAGYELRWALDAVRMADQPIEQLWMVGGAAQSTVWPEILADITGLPILIPEYDNWPALGAAILAGVGSGLYPDLDTALENFIKPGRVILPSSPDRNDYGTGFSKYKELIKQCHLNY